MRSKTTSFAVNKTLIAAINDADKNNAMKAIISSGEFQLELFEGKSSFNVQKKLGKQNHSKVRNL